MRKRKFSYATERRFLKLKSLRQRTNKPMQKIPHFEDVKLMNIFGKSLRASQKNFGTMKILLPHD